RGRCGVCGGRGGLGTVLYPLDVKSGAPLSAGEISDLQGVIGDRPLRGHRDVSERRDSVQLGVAHLPCRSCSCGAADLSDRRSLENQPTSDVLIEMIAKVFARSWGSRICAPSACKGSVFLDGEAARARRLPYLERAARGRSRQIVGVAIHLAHLLG